MGENILARKLKSCPLCGTVNVEEVKECVVCRWHGSFESEPDGLASSMEELLRQCPEVAEMIPFRRVRPSLFQKLKTVFYPGS